MGGGQGKRAAPSWERCRLSEALPDCLDSETVSSEFNCRIFVVYNFYKK